MPEGQRDVKFLRDARQRILAELQRSIVGQTEPIEELLTAFFAGGHCLITGVPGAAKTLLIASLAPIMNPPSAARSAAPRRPPADPRVRSKDRGPVHFQIAK